MGTVFREYLARKLPRWLLGTWGQRWAEGIGYLLDVALDNSKQSAKEGFILDCSDEAVPYHARDRRIEILSTDTYQTLRNRAANAWVSKSEMGPREGLQTLLRDLIGVSTIRIFDVSRNHWLSGYVNEDNLEDDDIDNWSRLWLVIPTPHLWEPVLFSDDEVIGPESTFGSTMTTSELSFIRRLVRENRPGHMDPMEFYLIFDSTTATAVLADHDASADYIRVPLYQTHVNYPHADTFGDANVFGETFD